MKNDRKRMVGLRLSAEQVEKLHEESNRTGNSQSSIMRAALDAHFRRRGRQ